MLHWRTICRRQQETSQRGGRRCAGKGVATSRSNRRRGQRRIAGAVRKRLHSRGPTLINAKMAIFRRRIAKAILYISAGHSDREATPFLHLQDL